MLTNLKHKFTGYTLIEILIVMAIFSALFLLGYSGFREYSRREQVNTALLGLTADVKYAQQQALAGKKPFGCTGNLKGYSVDVRSATSYVVVANCATNVDVKTVTVPTGITLTTPSPNPMLFKTVGDGTNIPPGNTATLTLTQTTTQTARSLYISSAGELREDTGLARASLTPTPTVFYATSTPKPSATPTVTPLPTPASTWLTAVSGWNVGCGTTANLNVRASQASMVMNSGGGGDGTISYNCYGSTGLSATTSNGAFTFQNTDCPMGAGATKTANFGSLTDLTQLTARLGCNDGETATLTVTYYGYPLTTTTYQESDSGIAYTGNWSTGSYAGASGGAYKVTAGTSDSASFTFTGFKIDYHYLRSTTSGTRQIYIDNVLVATIDAYSATTSAATASYTVTAGTHTIRVQNTNTKNASSTDYRMSIDAFSVTRY